MLGDDIQDMIIKDEENSAHEELLEFQEDRNPSFTETFNNPSTSNTTENTQVYEAAPVMTEPGLRACPYDFLVALDFKSTCDDVKSLYNREPTTEPIEIVAISFSVVSVKAKLIVHSEQINIKPIVGSVSSTCSHSTGLTNELLENAGSLQQALDTIDNFVSEQFVDKRNTFAFVTVSMFDLRTLLVHDVKAKGLTLAKHYSIFFDVVFEVNEWLYLNQLFKRRSLQNTSLLGMCKELSIQRDTLSSLSGIEDAVCLAEICVKLLERIEAFVADNEVITKYIPFTKAIDFEQELMEFDQSNSVFIGFAGLPFRALKSEMEVWCSVKNVTATMLYMAKTAENKYDGSGFIGFTNHAEAKEALSLNGTLLENRMISLRPTTQREVKAAEDEGLLFPFPEDKNRTMAESFDIRVSGTDSENWNCVGCQFSNFSTRFRCKQCGTDRNGKAPLASSHRSDRSHHFSSSSRLPPLKEPYKPGDWICPNHNCYFQNYASRFECKLCRTPNPATSSGSSSFRPPRSSSSYGGSSSPRATPYERSGGARTSGPTPRPRATDRPGDWNCVNDSCLYHNYATRMECYRCKTPKPAHLNVPPPTAYARSYTAPAPRSGDSGEWTCSNPSCGYHNYGGRDRCSICQSPNSRMQFGNGSGRNVPPVQPVVNPYAAYSQYYQMPPVVAQGGYVYNSATGQYEYQYAPPQTTAGAYQQQAYQPPPPPPSRGRGRSRG